LNYPIFNETKKHRDRKNFALFGSFLGDEIQVKLYQLLLFVGI